MRYEWITSFGKLRRRYCIRRSVWKYPAVKIRRSDICSVYDRYIHAWIHKPKCTIRWFLWNRMLNNRTVDIYYLILACFESLCACIAYRKRSNFNGRTVSSASVPRLYRYIGIIAVVMRRRRILPCFFKCHAADLHHRKSADFYIRAYCTIAGMLWRQTMMDCKQCILVYFLLKLQILRSISVQLRIWQFNAHWLFFPIYIIIGK